MNFVTDFLIPEVLLPMGITVSSAAGVLYFLSKRIIDHRLNIAMADKEAQLREKTAGLKNELSIYAHEQNVAASRVDEQRAKAIHAVFNEMRSAMVAIKLLKKGYVGPDDDLVMVIQYYHRKSRASVTAMVGLSSTLQDNAIYFDGMTDFLIGDFVDAIATGHEKIFQLTKKCLFGKLNEDEALIEISKSLSQLKSTFEVEIQQKHDNLVTVFRGQLGIEDDPS